MGGVYEQPPCSPALREGETIHSCPLHVPPSPPERTDGWSGLAPQPPPALAANTARASPKPGFLYLAGDTPALGPRYYSSAAETTGAGRPRRASAPAKLPPAPPLPPWPGAGGAEAGPLPLRGPSVRNPRHLGWGEEAFCSTAKKERSRRGAAVSQPEILFPFPHRVTCQKQTKSSSNTSPPGL